MLKSVSILLSSDLKTTHFQHRPLASRFHDICPCSWGTEFYCFLMFRISCSLLDSLFRLRKNSFIKEFPIAVLLSWETEQIEIIRTLIQMRVCSWHRSVELFLARYSGLCPVNLEAKCFNGLCKRIPCAPLFFLILEYVKMSIFNWIDQPKTHDPSKTISL